MTDISAAVGKRRTFAIISHPDAGKTTLTEKLLLFGGAIQTAGAVKSNKIKKSQKTVLSIRMIMMEFENIVSKLGLPVYQSINSRIKQTLSSEKHTMSMLTDFKNKKKIELKFSFQKLFLLSKLSGLKIDYSKKMYNLTLKKIYDKKK